MRDRKRTHVKETGSLSTSAGQWIGAHVVLRVEELIVDRSSPASRYVLADSFDLELRRLFVERGVPRSLSQSAERDCIAASATFQAGDNARGQGTGIAGAVYGALSDPNVSDRRPSTPLARAGGV
jgi:hypothetical protein